MAYYDNRFTVKFFDNSHLDEGYVLLVPANKEFSEIRISADEEFSVWGVVQYTIRNFRR